MSVLGSFLREKNIDVDKIIDISRNAQIFPQAKKRLFINNPLQNKVTIAIVKIPKFFDISAIIGAAPVPVPPPIPATINNISVPNKTFFKISLSSKALSLPILGLAPAPSPLVTFFPNCITLLADVVFNA